jgi:hypothetical protein
MYIYIINDFKILTGKDVSTEAFPFDVVVILG